MNDVPPLSLIGAVANGHILSQQIRRDCWIYPAAPMNSENHHHRNSVRVVLGTRPNHWRLRENLKIADVARQLGVSTGAWGYWKPVNICHPVNQMVPPPAQSRTG